MKRAINKLAWPYTGIALYDEMGHVYVALEGFVCGERYDMYLKKANFLAKYASKRSLLNVKIVAVDGFFDKTTMNKLRFKNAVFFAGCWHMIDSSLRTIFEPSSYNQLKAHLHGMIDAGSAQQFEELLGAAKELLQSMSVNMEILRKKTR